MCRAAVHSRSIPCRLRAIQRRRVAGADRRLRTRGCDDRCAVRAVAGREPDHRGRACGDVGMDWDDVRLSLFLRDQLSRAGVRGPVRAAGSAVAVFGGDPGAREVQALGRGARLGGLDADRVRGRAVPADRALERAFARESSSVRHHAVPGDALHLRAAAARPASRVVAAGDSVPLVAGRGQRGLSARGAAGLGTRGERARGAVHCVETSLPSFSGTGRFGVS